jgi:hypothetical protein
VRSPARRPGAAARRASPRLRQPGQRAPLAHGEIGLDERDAQRRPVAARRRRTRRAAGERGAQRQRREGAGRQRVPPPALPARQRHGAFGHRHQEGDAEHTGQVGDLDQPNARPLRVAEQHHGQP